MGNTVFSNAESTAAAAPAEKSSRGRGSSNIKADVIGKDDESFYYLTEMERGHLQTVYAMIFINRDGQPDPTGLRAALGNEPNDLIVNTLLEYLKRKKIVSYKAFEHCVIESTRVSGTQTIEVLWAMAEHASLESDDARNSKLFKLCRLMLLFAGDRLECDVKLTEQAEALVSFYHSVAKRNDPNENIETNQDHLVAIINEFSPHSAKAFQTYIGFRWLLAAESPSFKPYLPVELTLPSEILTPHMLPLLAMYGDEFQGSWKRLYSTYHDGLSFNRVAHHILGYDVSLQIHESVMDRS